MPTILRVGPLLYFCDKPFVYCGPCRAEASSRRRVGPYRFFFFSEESGEPVHVHVIREQTEAKVWVSPTVRVAVNEGFAQHELRKIVRLVEVNRELIEHEWNRCKKTS